MVVICLALVFDGASGVLVPGLANGWPSAFVPV
jgi:hypothetical protein